jgi:hypothetical protein
MISKNDWRHIYRILKISREEFKEKVRAWYADDKMSSPEICEKVYREHGIVVTPRSVQRTVRKLGIIRTGGEAFRMAMGRGRIRWEKSDKPKTARKKLAWREKYAIVTRDKWTCVECGFHHLDDSFQFLMVDYKVLLALGGVDVESNLQTLCVECHGKKTLVDRKAIIENQKGGWKRGGCYSGRDVEMRKKF